MCSKAESSLTSENDHLNTIKFPSWELTFTSTEIHPSKKVFITVQQQ